MHVQLPVSNIIDKIVLLKNNIARTPGLSQGIVNRQGASNLIPADLNGPPLLFASLTLPPLSFKAISDWG